ncbi:50S ribosomal protein L27 [Candidatus Amesbacteria bacterium RIFOXYB1_FULL_44_23]|uniref:Large ribosomal subunit protein bL27 n=1 Tax=Candidatus Amesbacteria bacterium RIFOXYB1_FULL_44_23 TaxID=1797263 RepID=A0A1F4ZU58_9BACT|nr:MAG: 50S ribosomal protein L27 [Candidatus Amesbacteria bacterium RIFOXYB1_FULL_44_23]
MAHTKAGGSTRQKGNRHGKRLGVKLFGGQKAQVGSILVRQNGSKVHPGEGVKMGRDFTLYSITEGLVKFIRRQGKKLITVVST